MAEPRPPALVLCAHGTRDPLGRATVRAVLAAVAERLPEVEVLEAYVDVHGPEVAEVVAGLPRRDGDAVAGVVVPLLLAAGYHVHVDIAAAVAGRPDVRATGALGPDDLLVDVLEERLVAAGAPRGGVVVLAPAGSSDARAQADSADMAARLEQRWGGAGATSASPPGRSRRWPMRWRLLVLRSRVRPWRSRRTSWRRGSSSAASRSRVPTWSPGRSRRTRCSSTSCWPATVLRSGRRPRLSPSRSRAAGPPWRRRRAR